MAERMADPRESHPTRVLIHLDRLGHNLRVLRAQVGERPLWPAIKANAYGHGAELIARRLVAEGCDTFCVAHAEEGAALQDAGIGARFVLLSAALPEQAEAIVVRGFEPVVCEEALLEALARAAQRRRRAVAIHVMVDTGMGRIGLFPEEVPGFLERCQGLEGVRVRGLMSHFPRADEADKRFAMEQIQRFARVCEATHRFDIPLRHFANSAATFDLPASHFDAVRPGIALYGLRPSAGTQNPQADLLRPVLEWCTRISFLKEVPAGVGLSYGHTFRTTRPSLIATLPVGYGDGLARNLSNRLEVLVGGRRCPQVGTITMDQMLVDVTALRGRVRLGDDVVLLGRQGDEEVHADEWAQLLHTIHYEIVTAIAPRVPRDVPSDVFATRSA